MSLGGARKGAPCVLGDGRAPGLTAAPLRRPPSLESQLWNTNVLLPTQLPWVSQVVNPVRHLFARNILDFHGSCLCLQTRPQLATNCPSRPTDFPGGPVAQPPLPHTSHPRVRLLPRAQLCGDPCRARGSMRGSQAALPLILCHLCLLHPDIAQLLPYLRDSLLVCGVCPQQNSHQGQNSSLGGRKAGDTFPSPSPGNVL